jgi:hypothetical protein
LIKCITKKVWWSDSGYSPEVQTPVGNNNNNRFGMSAPG